MTAIHELPATEARANGAQPVRPLVDVVVTNDKGTTRRIMYRDFSIVHYPDIRADLGNAPTVLNGNGRLNILSGSTDRQHPRKSTVFLEKPLDDVTVGEGITVVMRLKDGSEISVENGRIVTTDGAVDFIGEKVTISGASEETPLAISISEEDGVGELVIMDNTRLTLPGVNTNPRNYIRKLTVAGKNNRRTGSGEPLKSFDVDERRGVPATDPVAVYQREVLPTPIPHGFAQLVS